MTVLLGDYAARSCPVKTQNSYSPLLEQPTREPDEGLAELFDGGAAFENHVLGLLLERFPGHLVDLRHVADAPVHRRAACLEALRAGAEVIVGGWLPVDVAGGRVGQPSLLVRGRDQSDGTCRYHPVEVKWHKIIERRAARRGGGPSTGSECGGSRGSGSGGPRGSGSGGSIGPGSGHPSTGAENRSDAVAYSTLTRPAPASAQLLEGHGLRVATREGDLLQLAHYHRMLEAAGFATGEEALAAVIGSDDLLGEPVLAWVDLAEPLVRTFSRSGAGGWRLRSLLDRYDHEHAFRLDVAAVAQRQIGRPDTDPPLLVRPIVTKECGRCPWWEHCRPQLDPDDVSLRIDKGPLDVREIAALRAHGISTLTELANADLTDLAASYLPEVTHRSGAESRLRVATRRARMLLSGRLIERETSGPIDVPTAEVEIDFDIETSATGRIYLWGFLVNDATAAQPSVYRQFSSFADLDADAEARLARRAVRWLRRQVWGGRSVRVYHYSAYEVAAIRSLAERLREPLFDWALGYATDQFVDLLVPVQANFFGVSGLGLKMVAQQGAGFQWRDEDPGGLNSQRWFDDAVHEHSRALRSAARQRVLDYNEDDVLATARVRAWLRSS